MKALMVDEKDIDILINDFGFNRLTIYDKLGNEVIKAVAYEYDTETYLAIRKQKGKYVLEVLMINPDWYAWEGLSYFVERYTCYFLPSILIKLIKCDIIKECEIEDYN